MANSLKIFEKSYGQVFHFLSFPLKLSLEWRVVFTSGRTEIQRGKRNNDLFKDLIVQLWKLCGTNIMGGQLETVVILFCCCF